MTIKHFGRIDLQEAYQLFGLVEVDYDETYPHTTAQLKTWITTWSPYITQSPIAIQEGKNIHILLSKHHKILCYTHAKREVVVTAMVVLINLIRPYVSYHDCTSLDNILKNIFPRSTLVR